MSIGERLKAYRKAKSLSLREISKITGISQGALSDIENSKNQPAAKTIEAIVRNTDINPYWLLTGESEMFVKKEEEKKCLSENEFVFIPLIEGDVAAGPNGRILFEYPSDLLPFKRSWIESKFGKDPEHHKALILVQVQGNSMSPTINPGEVVLVDTWDDERINIRNGKIYLVRMQDGGLTIKRVVLSNGTIVCISDNPVYNPFDIPIEDGRPITWYIIGRVRWVGREID